MSYADALEQPKGFFNDRIVFIGGGPRIQKPGAQRDMFSTPYSRWNGEEVSGVELAATNFANLLQNDWWRCMSSASEFALLVTTSFLFALLFNHLRPWVSALSGVMLAVTIFGVAWFMAQVSHVWFAWTVFAGVQLPILWITVTACSLRQGPSAMPAQPRVTDPSPQPSLGILKQKECTVKQASETPRLPDHELLAKVGEGAYGEVWLARNAVNVLHVAKLVKRSNFQSNIPYEREFRGISKFMPISRSHPGFVHILHAGRNEDDSFFYYIMEAGDDKNSGQNIDPKNYSPLTLASKLKTSGRLPPQECVQLGVALSNALGCLHQAQLVHRDIKPSNIIFIKGAPKLADIGLVTGIASNQKDVSYVGTEGYIPPEGPGTPAADIFSLGKVMYEAWTGLDRKRFPEVPSALLDKATEVDYKLNQIILKACEWEFEKRYQSADAILQNLQLLKVACDS